MRYPGFFAALLAAGIAAGATADSTPYAIIQRPEGTIKASLLSEEDAGIPVAKVESSVITLRDLSAALAASHEAHGATELTAKKLDAGKKDFTPVLNRLIGVRLVFLEAHEIGLDQLPDVQQEMAAFEDASLREALKARVTKDIVADPGEARRRYEDSVREWKVKSVLFEKEQDARTMVASLKAGKPFDELVKAAVAARRGTAGGESVVSEGRKALPAVVEALRPLRAGQSAGPIKVEKGFAVLLVQQVLYPDDPQKKLQAEEYSLARKRSQELIKYYEAVQKTSVKRDDKLLARLDFEAKKPGFKALEKDKRVLARIEGGDPITVADLAKAIHQDFFHGIEQAIKAKKVNARKIAIFNDLLYREVFKAEARRLRLQETPEYRKSVADHRDALVLAKFIEKAVLPDVRITEGDLLKFYEEHKKDYTYPAFYTLSSIAFETRKAAESAFEKLKSGTDFRWLKSNAGGQLEESRRAIDFEGSTVSGRAMPADLANLLNGAKANDLRLYSAKEGGHYLVQVKAVTAPKPQPYAETREDIAPKVQRQKVAQALDEWIARLRKAHEVKVYITQISS